MKRVIHHILSIIFAAGLLISVIGIPVNDHYCSDTFVTTSIGLPLEDPCGDMPMAGDCCDDETTLFSITDYFSSTDISFFKKIVPAMLVCNYTACTKLIPLPVDHEIIAEHIPPPIESRFFIKIQSFLL